MNTFRLDIKSFVSLFDDKELSQAAYDPYFILGFITASASAPELISMSEWMPMLWREEDNQSGFSSDDQASVFMANVIGWWNECNDKFIEKKDLILPETLRFNNDEGISPELKEFASGYLNGYDWLKEIWDGFFEEALGADPEDYDYDEDALVDEEISDLSALIGMVTMTLLQCVIYPKELSESEDIPNFIDEISAKGDLVKFLGRVISEVGSSGHEIALDTQDFSHFESDETATWEESFQPYINSERHVGRNDPCPCGSGKKYKKCCLH